jgi:3-isopropylmalate/(R)-2-methylmalate dehydratase small subunit
MEQFTRLSGIAAPMLRINIDTDQIIPARFLVRASDEGIGEALFANLRFLPDGSPDPDFILNRPPWTGAQILLADRNFGCGSSREGAPKALRQWGFRCVIAPSFGGIFYNNCFRNGILPIEMPIEQVRRIADEMERSQGQGRVTIDLEAMSVTTPEGSEFAFTTPTLLREMLLKGQDEVELTLSRAPEIQSFRAADRQKRPWIYKPGLAV